MIAKQIVGREMRGALAYVSGKEGARRITGNIASSNLDDMVREFRHSEQLNSAVSRTVYHVSLSAANGETLSDRTWRTIVKEYLRGMGFAKNQYVAYQHVDTDEQHVHVIASRIDMVDGSCVSDSWNYRQSETLLRSIESKYGLTPVPPSREKRDRAPKTGEIRMMRRRGEESVRIRLQQIVQEVVRESGSAAELRAKLTERGVEVRYRREAGGEIVGVSFALEGVAFQGRQLGSDFSWSRLGAALDERSDEADSREVVEQQEAVGKDEQAGKEAPVKSRTKYFRKHYQAYKRLVRERFTERALEGRNIDVAIAVLAFAAAKSIAYVRELIRNSDTVREIIKTESENGGQALRYVEGVTTEAAERIARSRVRENEAIEMER